MIGIFIEFLDIFLFFQAHLESSFTLITPTTSSNPQETLYLLHYGENRFQVPHFQSLRPISNDRENLIQNYVASLSVHHSSQSNSNIVVSSGLVRGRIDSAPEEPANFAQPNLQSSCILSESNQRIPVRNRTAKMKHEEYDV